jgi:thiamine pyrophosphokinase
MSSHHIVREKQEPALLIAGLDNFPDELLGQLLEWSPTVIVTAETAERVEAYGIKIDCLVADAMPEMQQSDIKLIPNGGDDPLTTALQYLAAQGYPAVNIVTDELLLDAYAPFVAQMDVVIFYKDKKVVSVHSGFSKWKPAGDRLEILTLSHNFLYTGLSPVADNVFETTQDGFFSLSFSDPYLFIAEHL